MVNTSLVDLEKVVEGKIQSICFTLSQMQNPHIAIVEVIRQLDYYFEYSQNLNRNIDKDIAILGENLLFGWLRSLKMLFRNLEPIENIVTHVSDERFSRWVTSMLGSMGGLEISKRYVELAKVGLLELRNNGGLNFSVKKAHQFIEVEIFERRSYYVNQLVCRKSIEDNYLRHLERWPSILMSIRERIESVHPGFISYQSTPEIDQFYSELGYYKLLMLQGYEEFGEGDLFGGITYRKYIDFLEEIIGVASKHRDFCFAYLEKFPDANPLNLFTYNWYWDNTVESYARYLQVTQKEAEQIISCFTLSKENIESYDSPGFIAPPFIRLGSNFLVRSSYGCLQGGVGFLNRELKRRFGEDYFKAVNNREGRFRRDLYSLFKEERFICIDREIVIGKQNASTDIDAIVFDKTSGTLGLFQLKWQDVFGTSTKERYSRISNLFPKAIEWIDKVCNWMGSAGPIEMRNKLNLPKQAIIEDVQLFVIARNNIHFTGQALDKRAAWGSWYQIIEAYSTVWTEFADPIAELGVMLRILEPVERVKMEGMPETESFKIDFKDFSIDYDGEF